MVRKFLSVVALGLGLAASANADLIEVDLELQLLVDVSGSVDSAEYALQKSGYEASFRSANVINAIVNGNLGKIAVQYIEWSSNNMQKIGVDWFLISDASSANAFADLLAAQTRAFSNLTGVGAALNFGKSLFDSNDYSSARQVMDVSGDGENNSGITAIEGRNAALAAGVDTINGIAIEDSTLVNYYTNNVIGGANAFVEFAASFDDFESAINRKLVREISNRPLPEPGSLALFILAGFGLMSMRRRS